MTRDEVKLLLARISELWPGRTQSVSELTVEVWADLFAGLPADSVNDALMGYVESGEQHPPSAPSLYHGAAMTLLPSLDQVKRWVRHSGEIPDGCPPAVEAVIDALGGPLRLAMMNDEQFVRAYDTGQRSAARAIAATLGVRDEIDQMELGR